MANAGKLNERLIYVGVGISVPDGIGGFVETPDTPVTTWCRARQLSQKESVSLGLILEEANYEFQVRYEQGRHINTDSTLTYKNRTFRVTSPPRMKDENDRIFIILASERESLNINDDAGLFEGFTTLGDGWTKNADNSYTSDGTQGSTSFLVSELTLENGEVYLVDITASETLGTGGVLAFLSSAFTDSSALRTVNEGTEVKELTAAGGVVEMSIAATTRITFKINSIKKK